MSSPAAAAVAVARCQHHRSPGLSSSPSLCAAAAAALDAHSLDSPRSIGEAPAAAARSCLGPRAGGGPTAGSGHQDGAKVAAGQPSSARTASTPAGGPRLQPPRCRVARRPVCVAEAGTGAPHPASQLRVNGAYLSFGARRPSLMATPLPRLVRPAQCSRGTAGPVTQRALRSKRPPGARSSAAGSEGSGGSDPRGAACAALLSRTAPAALRAPWARPRLATHSEFSRTGSLPRPQARARGTREGHGH